MLRHRKPVAAVLACAAVAVSGCGGADTVPFTKGGPPAPKVCLERWNADQSATNFGKHAYYGGHNSRAAQVFRFRGQEPGRPRECAVIFAAYESDREYGTLGEASYSGGWEVMNQFPALGDPAGAQRRAASKANAKLSSDGKIAPLD